MHLNCGEDHCCAEVYNIDLSKYATSSMNQSAGGQGGGDETVVFEGQLIASDCNAE